jgi:PPM family protein phosphatase
VIIRGWGAVTDVGRARSMNQDALIAEPPLFVVADGMGGHAAGDVASRLAIESFVESVGSGPIGAEGVIDALAAANQAIVDAAAADPGLDGMGTTIAGLIPVLAAGSEHWMVFNVGDSRVYRFVNRQLTQLTVDHSEAEEMVIAGQITREQVREYEHRNVVTRSLGSDPAPSPDSWVFPSIDGERFLLCSDGLTREVRDEDILDRVASADDPQSVAEELLDLALTAGGSDNVTVIVVDGAGRSPESVVEEDTVPRGRDVTD